MSAKTKSDIGLNIDPIYIERFWSKVNKKNDTECWEWTGCLQKNGYGCFGIENGNKIVRTHRFSFMIHHNRNINTNMYILHSCDNRKCCNPYHLREGTQKENVADAINRNRWIGAPTDKKGEENGSSKLMEQQVIEIRQKYISHKYPQYKLADEYGVSKTLIGNIIRKECWKHI